MIEERYLAATQASSLADEPHKISQVDVIKACGMSSRNMAAHYLRLISKPTRSDMERVAAALLSVVQNRKLAGGEGAIALAMEWLLSPNCRVCGGTGIVTKKEMEHKCPRCKGEGKRKEPVCRDAQVLIDYVMGCRHSHKITMNYMLR